MDKCSSIRVEVCQSVPHREHYRGVEFDAVELSATPQEYAASNRIPSTRVGTPLEACGYIW